MSRLLKAAAFFATAVGLVGSAAGQPDNPLLKLAKAAKDGKLTQDDFLKAFAKSPKGKDNPGFGKVAFAKLDANKDGFLTADELRVLGDKKGFFPGKSEKAPAKAEPTASGFNDRPTPEQIAFFEKKVRPVLVENCYKCHSGDSEKLKGGLALDTRAGVRQGGESGPAVVPGSAERSLLVRAIRSADQATAMPPKGKLPDHVIADLEAWVKMGAPDPRDGAKVTRQEIDVVKGREFWSFRAPKKTLAPAVKDAAWPRSDIDRFLLAALEAKGLHPVADAQPATLIRRVYLDLTGLPPTAEEVEAFAADASPKAFETVVDRLLASPRFGERWGRHWLDVARYAETSGKTANFNHPHAWRYRDYVIASFNADKPYDQFVKEQLAGDLMPSADPAVRAERVIATGFLAIGPKALNERNGIQFELDVADEQIDVTTQAFLGITAACARCHDHKFDPIPQRDYYALAGIFRSTETCYGTVRFVQSQRPSSLIELPKGSGAPSALDPLTAAERARTEKAIADITQRMKDTKEPINNLFNVAQLALNKSKLDSFDADGTPKLLAMGVREKPAGFGGFGPGFGGPKAGMKGGFGPGGFGTRTVADSPLYARGEVDKPGEVVPRGFLQVLTPNPRSVRGGSGRKELADAIASADNPLTARVMVNRVWLNLFGRGLVPTPDNFGAAGRPPTNPALLDYLAVTFADDGWGVKRLIRRIVLSRAYQLDSRTHARNFEADPDNALVWRMSPRRLDAEALRDSMLATSGLLDLTPSVGSAVAKAGEGPSNRPQLGGFNAAQAAGDARNNKRSVYLPVIRDNLPEAIELFDGADPSLVVSERPTTTVPAQGLFLLNSPFALRVADAAADRVLKDTTADSERVRAAYQFAYARTPTDSELTTATQFVEQYRTTTARTGRGPRGAATDRDTWSALMQALLASAEFQYRK
ncbi:PSD1 domain-containing protein [bacterium]|nr:PSD1 domain-containing protein [bacterium]